MFNSGQRIVQAGQRVQNPGKTYSCSTRKQRGDCWEVIWMLLPLVRQRKAKNISGSWLNLPKQEFPSREFISSSPQCWQVYIQCSALQRGNTHSQHQSQAGWGCCKCTAPNPLCSVRGTEYPLPRQKTLRSSAERRDHGLPFAGWGSDWNRKKEHFSTELLERWRVLFQVYPAAVLMDLQVSQHRSQPTRFHSSWHIFPIYRELLE